MNGPQSAGSAPDQAQEFVAVHMPHLRPLVTYSLLGVTIAVYLLQMASNLFLGEDLPLYFGAKYTPFILEGQLWRLLTPMLLHGSLAHIGFNMYALYTFGRDLERFYGHARFLALYLLAAYAGNVASFLITDAPSVGASTAIYGLLAAEGIFLYTNRQLFGKSAQRTLYNIAFVAAANLLISLAPGIDLWGHVGGLIGGSIFAWFSGPQLAVQGFYPEFTLEDRREPRTAIQAGIVVGLLFSGLAALRFWMG